MRVCDLLRSAAVALREGDEEALMDLEHVVDGWVQSDEERTAQLEMLAAMLEVLDVPPLPRREG